MPRILRRFRSRPVLGVAVVIGVLVPLAVAAASGNLSIPHNDAWAYSRIAASFAETGRIELVGWNRAALVGQIVVLGPFAGSLVVQQVFVACLGVLLLVAVHELLAPRLGAARAGVATLAVALWPGFALLTTSFMADVPMAATAFAGLWAADRALRSDSRWLFLVAMLLGLWSCLIRMQGVAAPVAVAIVFLLAHRRLDRVRPWLVVLASGLVAVAFIAFTVWHARQPANDPASYALHPDAFPRSWHEATQAWFQLALVAGPAALALARPWQWRWRALAAGGATAAIGLLLLRQTGPGGFFLPNYVSASGPYSAVLPPGRVMVDEGVWRVVVLGAIVLGAVLAACVAESTRVLDHPVLAWFSAATLAGTLLTFPTDQQAFGRYLVVLVPWAVAIATARPSDAVSRDGVVTRSGALSRGGPASRHGGAPHAGPVSRRRAVPRWRARVPRLVVGASACTAAVAVGGLSAAITLNGFAHDRARWDVGEAEVARGIPATRVHAGLEWMGWHSAVGVVRRYGAGGWGFDTRFSDAASCSVLVDRPPEQLAGDGATADWVLDRVERYRTFLIAGDSALYVYRTHAPGCRP